MKIIFKKTGNIIEVPTVIREDNIEYCVGKEGYICDFNELHAKYYDGLVTDEDLVMASVNFGVSVEGLEEMFAWDGNLNIIEIKKD